MSLSSSSSEFSNLIDENSVTSSPVHVSTAAESSEEEQINGAPPTPLRCASWPKYKHFKDPQSGEEAVYVLLDQPLPHHRHKAATKRDEAWKVCRQLLDLSSISLFVASNLLAFTVGLLLGKRSVEF
jgi:hypothetical protein